MKTRVFFFITLLIAMLLSSMVFALDVPHYTSPITDQANLLTLQEKNDLEKIILDYRARSTNQIGVLIIPSLDGESPEDFARKVFQEWGIGLSQKNNGVLVLIALADHVARIEIGYGLESDFTDRESGRITSRQSKMADAFRKKQFAEGVGIAIQQIIEAIGVPASTSTGTATKNQGAALKENDSWNFVLEFFIVILAIAFVIGMWMYIRHRIELNRRRKLAKENFLSVKTEACNKLEKVTSGLKLIRTVMETLRNQICVEELKALEAYLKNAEHNEDVLVGAFQEPLAFVKDEDKSRKSELFYMQAKKKFADLLPASDVAITQVETLKSECNLYNGNIMEARSAGPDVANFIIFAEKQIAYARSKGFKVEKFLEQLEVYRAQLKKADTLFNEKRVVAALEVYRQTRTSLKIFIEEVRAHPGKCETLQAAIQEEKKRIPDVLSKIGKARQVFDALKAKYAESSWTETAGNGSKAESNVQNAGMLFEQAEKAASMEVQDFESADKQLTDASHLLDDALMLVASIITLHGHLESAEKTCKDDVAHAQRDVDEAAKANKAVDDDVPESVKTDLESANGFIAQANAELENTLPDFLMVVRFARKAHEIADAVLNTVRKEHAAMERLREEYVTTKRDAERKIDTATDYVKRHKSVVGVEVFNILGGAAALLLTAAAAKDLLTKVEVQKDAHSKAEEALKMAKAAVTLDEKRKAEAAAAAAALLIENDDSDDDDDDDSGSISHHHSDGGGGGGGFSFGGGHSGGAGSTGGW